MERFHRTMGILLGVLVVLASRGALADLTTWGDGGETVTTGSMGTFDGKPLYFEIRSEPFTSGYTECILVVKATPEPLQGSFSILSTVNALVLVDPLDYTKLVTVPQAVQVLYSGLTTPCAGAKVTQEGEAVTITYATSGKHSPTYQHVDVWNYVEGGFHKSSVEAVALPEEE